MIATQPIGLFDSGIGGTSIWKEIHLFLPNENYIYLADTKNAPYGQKTKEEIIHLSFKNTEFLLNNNCKIIVVACNTATTNAIKEMRAKYDIPFIGIEPAIKPAASNSQTRTIGVLATKSTLSSDLFNSIVACFNDEVHIIEQVGYGLVQLIENGAIESPEMTELLHAYLTPMIEANIDYLVLGCSHYSYLTSQIRKIIPVHIKIIDSSEAVAKQTLSILSKNNGINRDNINKSRNIFYTNGNTKVLSSILDHKYPVIEKNF